MLRPYAILCAAVICVYAQSIRFDFVNYDDDELIYHNAPFLADWGNVRTAFTSHAFSAAGGESVYYRPFLITAYIAEFHLWKLAPAGYHAVNVALHAATVLLVFLLARVLLAAELPALFAALIAALHPVQTEAVGWVAGGNDLLLGLFVTLMALAYLKGRRTSAIWFACALLTKESAAFYLLLLPLADATILRSAGLAGAGPAGAGLARRAARYLPHAAVLALYLALRLEIFGALIGAERLYGSRGFGERLMMLPALAAEHLRLILLPIHLSVAHPVTELVWLNAPWNVAAVALTAGLIAAFALALKRDAVMAFGLGWLVIGLLPVLGIFPLAIPIFEHRLYVPLIGAAIAAGRIVARVPAARAALAKPAVMCLSIVLAVSSFVRLPVWKNGVALFDDAVGKSPRDARSYYSLATAFYEERRYRESAAALQEYLGLAPHDLRGETFLREVYYLAGRTGDALEVSRGMTAREPLNGSRWLETGEIYQDLRMPDSAAACYRTAIALDSLLPDPHLQLGKILDSSGRSSEAAAEFRKACDLGSAGGCFELAKIYAAGGRDALAIGVLEPKIHDAHVTPAMIALLRSLYERNGELLKAAALSRGNE